MSEPFIAEIRIFAGNFAPRGWAFCDGQLLQIAQNTALFSLIGTTYGGDGRTTTGLPNLQGRAPMHAGNGPGLTNRRLGEKGGAETVTLSEAQMAQHSHSLVASEEETGDAGASTPVGNWFGSSIQLYQNDAPNVSMSGAMVPDPAGGNQAHNNLQPFLTMYFIIALTGLYPSRN
jgi:microcystin-dependent protein